MKSKEYLPLGEDDAHGAERFGGGNDAAAKREKHDQRKAGRDGQPCEQGRSGKTNSPGRANASRD